MAQRRATLRFVGVLCAALLVAALLGSMTFAGVWAQSSATPDEDVSDELRAAIAHIAELFNAQQFDVVIREAGPLLARHGLTPTSVWIVLFEAESRLRLGDRDGAIRAYERGLAVTSTIDNVQQRRFAWVYFRLATLAWQKQQLDQAATKAEAGLRLEPQNTPAQILLGELLNERGDRARALMHFKEVASSSFPSNEERAVLTMKIDRLTTGATGSSVRPPDLRGAHLYEGVSIGLIPLIDVPKGVRLADVCVALEAAWRIACEVLPPVSIPDADVFVRERGQYDGERHLTELSRRVPAAARTRRYLLAFAGRDLFGAKSRYVFSWQTRDADSGIGVMSTYRFAALLSDFYEKDAVLMRRVTIQAISTSGSMLGITRPTNPECPTAFPVDFREFQQKRVRLCASDAPRVLLRLGQA